MTKNIVGSKTNLRRIISGWLENFDITCYTMDYETLVDYCTDDILDYIRGEGFKFGNVLPDISPDTWERITKQYERV